MVVNGILQFGTLAGTFYPAPWVNYSHQCNCLHFTLYIYAGVYIYSTQFGEPGKVRKFQQKNTGAIIKLFILSKKGEKKRKKWGKERLKGEKRGKGRGIRVEKGNKGRKGEKIKKEGKTGGRRETILKN